MSAIFLESASAVRESKQIVTFTMFHAFAKKIIDVTNLKYYDKYEICCVNWISDSPKLVNI